MVYFDPFSNQWYMSIPLNGKTQRVYLEVYFAENKSKAVKRALELLVALTENKDMFSVETVPCGLLSDVEEDFRELIGQG